MSILIDSYDDTNSNPKGLNNLRIKQAQSFTSYSSDLNLSSVKFTIRKNGSPTGYAYATLYAHSGTYGSTSKPTGTALATSNSLDVSSLTTSDQVITFTFSTSYKLLADTYYCIAIEYTGTSSNFIYVRANSSSPTHDGNSSYYYNSAWNIDSGVDMIFEVYGEEVASGNIKKINNIAWANVKKINNIAVANIKKINNITAQ